MLHGLDVLVAGPSCRVINYAHFEHGPCVKCPAIAPMAYLACLLLSLLILFGKQAPVAPKNFLECLRPSNLSHSAADFFLAYVDSAMFTKHGATAIHGSGIHNSK
ncbi:jg5925 [Pararge aegeria aegeria]|uniref:Jg5925 protein n=1 Tax=Pararge aegeria aegeria TaxID=348720 RepID=A0A8S4RI02_9NEOP|nr:jg5925 [Pararge aegeria aegeria]